jgi:Carboxypeptidase regulatory-like domain
MTNIHRRNRIGTLAIQVAVFGVLGAAPYAAAQGLTGQIGGTVIDASKAVIPGVIVTVRNTETQVTREVVSDAGGSFVITNLLAGTYDITVSLAGFKTYQQKGLVLTATERLALPPITLAVGGLEESVLVTGESPLVQTQSGERSAVIRSTDLEDRGLKGRDPFGTLNILPGIVDTRNRDAPAAGNTGGLTINGQTSINFSYDGVTSKDTGSNSNNFAAPALDSIAEIKLQASNFQAEYGRSSGATIVVVTKSGTQQFRGTAAYFRRDERFNANTWERNQQCYAGQTESCAKPPYQYNNTTYTFGGPVTLGKFNARRDKLFFFWSQDLLPKTNPNTLQRVTMPTALERQGDFSQTFDRQGRRIWIKDPLTTGVCNAATGGPGCFANNVIPADRFDPIGRAILNLLPLPNATDPSGTRQFNYTYQNVFEQPRNDQVLRIDYNVRQGTTFYSRLQFGHEVVQRGLSASLGSANNGGWPQFHTSRENNTVGLVNTLLYSLNSSTVMEVTVGTNWAKQSTLVVDPASLDRNDRTKVLPNLPQFFPQSNPLNLIPNMTFAGTNAVPNAPSFVIENRFPFTARDDIWNASTNLTKVAGAHNMKAGIFVETTFRPASRASFFNGTISFNGSTSNPFDTNFPFANALLGSVNQYTESTDHPYARGRYNQVEFFAQDNWRVSNTFTLDYGSRFYYVGPTFVGGQQVAYFDPGAYDRSRAPLLYVPACSNGAATCSGTTRVAMNPVDGQLLNNTFIGKLVPGTGDFTDGMVVQDATVYNGVFRPAPRIGFAWDPTGSHKMAVRGGAGVFYDRYSDDTILRLIEPAPFVDTRITNFTTLPQLLNSPLTASTQSGARAFTAGFTPPTVYNWSLGVQRELPFRLVADVAYVGNAGRHTSTTFDVNSLPYGTARPDLNASSGDPTNNNQPKQADFLRAFRGFQGVTTQTWQGYNNYHSIQVSVNRRLSRGLAWGVAYTGSIRHTLTTIDPFLSEADNKARNYTMNGSRPHNLVVNYNYQVPDLSARWHNAIARAFDDWQVTGVSIFQSGAYTGIGFQNNTPFVGAPYTDMSGGPGFNFQRVTLVCDPRLPASQRTAGRQFNTDCIKAPGPLANPSDIYYVGNALNDVLLSPGYVNHDLSIFKNFPMGNRRNVQFRMEFYNLFNSAQFGGSNNTVDTDAQFDFATGRQLNQNFGRVIRTRDGSARVIQLGIRLAF